MTELVPYTEHQRDELELELAERDNKVDLMYRRNAGMVAILYRLMKECVCTIYVEDERTNTSYEYEVPSEGCLEAWKHAFSHPDANIPRYEQGSNNV